MNITQRQKLTSLIEEAIEKVTNTDEFTDELISMYWGRNTVRYAAEAATNVIIACAESQEESEVDK